MTIRTDLSKCELYSRNGDIIATERSNDEEVECNSTSNHTSLYCHISCIHKCKIHFLIDLRTRQNSNEHTSALLHAYFRDTSF